MIDLDVTKLLQSEYPRSVNTASDRANPNTLNRIEGKQGFGIDEENSTVQFNLQE